MNNSHKICTLSEASAFVTTHRKQSKKIVFTNGCFDLIHPGHVDYLEKAKALGDILIVGINNDHSVATLKGSKRPICNQKDRCLILAALSSTDYIVLFAEETPINLIKTIKPDILVKGGDWQPEQIVGGVEVSSYGGTILSLPFITGYSSSRLIDRILELYA